MDSQFISIFQIILSFILVGLILLQTKGTGLGSTFGGESGFYSSRRGAEKIIFKLTLVISALFLGSALLRLVLN